MLLVLTSGAFTMDVLLHPEREEVILTLPDGDTLVRTRLERWITGSHYELRRMHEGRIASSHPDWVTNLVGVEHGVVEISRGERITILDYELAPLAEIVPAPGTAVFHSVDWISGLLVVRSRPLDIHQENQLEVRDASTLTLAYRVPIAGTSTLLPLSDRLFLMDPHEGVREVTRDGILAFSDDGARDPCVHRDGFVWVSASDGSLHSRTLTGPTVVLRYDASARALERCLVCPEGMLVVIAAAPALREMVRYEGEATTAFTLGLDPAAPIHVVAFDQRSRTERWAFSTSRSFRPTCEAGALRDGDLVLGPRLGD